MTRPTKEEVATLQRQLNSVLPLPTRYWIEQAQRLCDAYLELEAELAALKAENEKYKDQGRVNCDLFDDLKRLSQENWALQQAFANLQAKYWKKNGRQE